MKYFLLLLVFVYSCSDSSMVNELNKQEKLPETIQDFRTDFTDKEKEIMDLARDIIDSCYFGTFITIDEKGQPRARIMEPFAPDETFTIWLGTNPRSRKVTQLKANSATTVHYFDKKSKAYVSLMGNAVIVKDQAVKDEKFMEGWERFYKNRKEDYMLLKFVPHTLELISIEKRFSGDRKTWKPHQVRLRGG